MTVLLGLLGLGFPAAAMRLVGIEVSRPHGRLDVRATYGGLFIGAGLAVLILGSRDAALVLGAAWIGAFLARALSTVVDRSMSKENLAGLVIEAAIGTMLILG